MKQKVYFGVFALSAIIASCGSSESNENSVKKSEDAIWLKLNPKQGEVYNMNYIFSVSNDSTGDKTTFSIDVSNKIEKVTNDKIQVDLTYNNASMKAFLQGQEVSVEANSQPSENSQANLVAAPVFVFINKTVQFEYDFQFRKIKETILQKDSIPALQNSESKVQFIARYPDHELKIGQTWKGELELKVGNKNVDNATYTLKNVSDNIATIEVNAKIDTKGEKFGHEFSMQGNLKGEFKIDVRTGWQNKGQLNLDFVLSMMGNKTPMKQSINFGLSN